ncbi:hypothetical protein BS50DRAFT_671003 [Corynespora cassiicola Philippines]|uniref:RING-type domain-containing protein n=1 Tax=Corynespora cassiicola Philippines TaxID=1448308 RepID=A0A2T2PAI6_CORCC|nr:hypothetical protein BS50DRAFT_671003 [Corynespora cassiicola Philippines]
MGTLTADCPRLDSHCPHKLATSCRLTSTPNCCACADERPHSQTYRVYIDGVGFVQRGTRWQSYCWFCKEFWNNRLASTDPPLQPSQTQIPHIPDQAPFLERWFEFHQGYRVVKNAEGIEQRIAVIGEPLRDVSPGFLPRTLDQLRAGRENDATRPENIFRLEQPTSTEQTPEEPQESLEDVLDQLLDEAQDEESATSGAQESTPPLEPPQQDNAGIAQSASRAQRALERAARVFGTREDVQRDDYESPLASMYGRAMDRYRQAEQRRAAGDTTAPPVDGLSTQERRDIEEQLMWGVLRESQASIRDIGRGDGNGAEDFSVDSGLIRLEAATRPITYRPGFSPPTNAPSNASLTSTSASTPSAFSSDLRVSLEQITSELARLRTASEAVASARHALHAHRNPDPPVLHLDNQPDRPAPKTDEEMTKNLSCQICYSQVADIAVVPCGHMVMCQWCADVVIPVKHSHLPVRPSKCPMCRKTVRQRFKIHTG